MGIRWDAFYVALFFSAVYSGLDRRFRGLLADQSFPRCGSLSSDGCGSVFLRGLSVFVDSRWIRGMDAVFLGVVGFFVCCSPYRVLGLDPSTTNRDDDDKKQN